MVPLRGLTNERSPTRDQAKLRARGIIVQRGLNCHGSLKPASIVHKFLSCTIRRSAAGGGAKLKLERFVGTSERLHVAEEKYL